MLDDRRTALWNALGLGPQWVRRETLIEAKKNQPQPEVPAAAAKSAPASPVAKVPVSQPKSATTAQRTFESRPAQPRTPPRTPVSAPVAVQRKENTTFVRPATAPSPEIIKAADWSALTKLVEGCQGCELCKGRMKPVFAAGEPPAKVVLIGEGPGRDEDIQGIPFVGAAGKLLDKIMYSIGLKRGEGVAIINSVKCRPPYNRDPLPEEMETCRPFLERQIELLDPELIVLLGLPAVKTVLKLEERIGSLRGKVFEQEIAGKKRRIIVTYHPAYYLRSRLEKRKAWTDWCFIADTIDTIDGKKA